MTELPAPMDHRPFVAVDFETADRGPDSACAVALVRVEGGSVVRREVRLVRPPRPVFTFTYIHGIKWKDVKDQPTFAELWPALSPLLDGAEFLAAHNAAFDRRVLEACCLTAGHPVPGQRFVCTVQVARQLWKLRPAPLPDVCRFLGVPLQKHHDPAADAEACAGIVVAALRAAGPAAFEATRPRRRRYDPKRGGAAEWT